MSSNPMRCTLVGGAVVALAVLISPVTLAAEATEAVPDAAPVVVAQAAAPSTDARPAAMTFDEYPRISAAFARPQPRAPKRCAVTSGVRG